MARTCMVMAVIAGLATVAQAAPVVTFGEYDYGSQVFTPTAGELCVWPGGYLVIGVGIQSDGVEFNSFDIFPVIDDGGMTLIAGEFDPRGELYADLGGFFDSPAPLFSGFKQIEPAVPPFNPGVPGWNGDYFVGYLVYQVPDDLTNFRAELGLTGNTSFTFDGGEDLGFGEDIIRPLSVIPDPAWVPDPATLALLGMGGLAVIRRRR